MPENEEEFPFLTGVRAVVSYVPCAWSGLSVSKLASLTKKNRLPHVQASLETDECYLVPSQPYTECGFEELPYQFWKSLLLLEKEFAATTPQNLPEAVKEFYATYGPITAFGYHWNFESAASARKAIALLGDLVRVVDRLKARDLNYIERRFLGTGKDAPAKNLEDGCILGVNGQRQSFRLDLISEMPMGITDGAEENDASPGQRDLMYEAWQGVESVVQEHLSEAKLIPIKADYPKDIRHPHERPVILYGFEANWALQAAFLQWFFDEIGGSTRKRCVCGKPIADAKKTWCSTTCRGKYYKRYEKERKEQDSGNKTEG